MALYIINYMYVYIYTLCIKRNTTIQSLRVRTTSRWHLLRIAPFCYLLAPTPTLPTHTTTQKYFTTIRRFSLTYYGWRDRLAEVFGEGNVIFSRP